MKTIINGKRYDTEKATFVAEYSEGYGSGDFRFLEEKLYRTQNGSWFLHGQGGPLTDYCEQHGSMRTGSERIEPFTENEAAAWLERTNNFNALEMHFADKIAEA